MKLIRDVGVIVISIFVAVILVRTHVFESLFRSLGSVWFLGAFVAGLFFTSAFTTPISIVAFGEMAMHTPVWQLALVGCVGALIGDLVIYTLIKDTFAEDVKDFLRVHRYKKLRAIFKLRIFRWLTPTLGALIIASPLPDELGLAMMGFSRMKVSLLVPVSLALNFLGIVLIGYIAHIVA
jgi:hypothetical protein